MKQDRIEELYHNRKWLTEKTAKKRFPLEHALKKPMTFHPERPEPEKIDILEIGPGKGEFLIHLASENPEKNILGIELANLRFRGLQKKQKALDLQNLFLIHGDARTALFGDFQKMQLEKIYILFPDPWPKNSQRHMRLLNKDFALQIEKLLQANGEFIFASDVKDYVDWVEGLIQGLSKTEVVERKQDESFTDLIPTSFEKKWQHRGRHCHYLRSIKKVSS